MSDVKKAEIEVKAKSKTGNGIMAADESWYNASKNVSFAAINKGDKLQLSYLEGAQGGKFVTAYTKTNVAAVPAQSTPVAATTVAATSAPVVSFKADDKMSKADWEAKDYKIVKGGVAHDAAAIVASMAPMKTLEEVKQLYTDVYKHILSTVQE